MRTLIVVLTPDKRVSQTVGSRKTSLIPTAIRRKHTSLFIASVHIGSEAKGVDDVLCLFRKMDGNITGVIVLCDNRLAEIGAAITTPFFTVWYDHAFEGKNINNYFGMVIGKVIRCFGALSNRFDDEKHRKLLILPLRNFRSGELNEIHLLFKGGVTPSGDFSTTLDKLLKRLRERQTPKVESPYKTTFIVDDKQRYYEYGNEKHAKPDTKIPPHVELCAVAAIYRFGRRYDSERHFNVSLQKGEISGSFGDCHNTPTDIAPRSHINMFPNDFMA